MSAESKPNSLSIADRIFKAITERQRRIDEDIDFFTEIGQNLADEKRITGFKIRRITTGVQIYFRSNQPCLDSTISDRHIAIEEFPQSDSPNLITVRISELCQPYPAPSRMSDGKKEDEQITILLEKSEVERAQLPKILEEHLPKPVELA